ncbi:MAG: Uma2 family endonuclease [Candidatus Korobacteraceae bacterium]
MASTTLISVHEYLSTSYRPDCDFIDGELRERNLGELEHALIQSAVLVWFWGRQKEWNILPVVEQRVQVAATRFRIPDVSVLRADHPREPIITTPPLILIEVLSKDDTLRSMRERVDDYLNFGVQHIWILDPGSRRAYVCSRTGFQEPESGVLSVPGTPIRLVLSELFSQVQPTS